MKSSILKSISYKLQWSIISILVIKFINILKLLSNYSHHQLRNRNLLFKNVNEGKFAEFFWGYISRKKGFIRKQYFINTWNLVYYNANHTNNSEVFIITLSLKKTKSNFFNWNILLMRLAKLILKEILFFYHLIIRCLNLYSYKLQWFILLSKIGALNAK